MTYVLFWGHVQHIVLSQPSQLADSWIRLHILSKPSQLADSWVRLHILSKPSQCVDFWVRLHMYCLSLASLQTSWYACTHCLL